MKSAREVWMQLRALQGRQFSPWTETDQPRVEFGLEFSEDGARMDFVIAHTGRIARSITFEKFEQFLTRWGQGFRSPDAFRGERLMKQARYLLAVLPLVNTEIQVNSARSTPGVETIGAEPNQSDIAATTADELEQQRALADSDGDFDPTDTVDARTRTLAAIVRRQGQKQFRDALLTAYERKCAITGFDMVSALEAAHIQPYLGERTNAVTNGLLLRADIHTLFDLGLLAIDPETLQVRLSDATRNSEYKALDGIPLRVPKEPRFRPSFAALKSRWASTPQSLKTE